MMSIKEVRVCTSNNSYFPVCIRLGSVLIAYLRGTSHANRTGQDQALGISFVSLDCSCNGFTYSSPSRAQKNVKQGRDFLCTSYFYGVD